MLLTGKMKCETGESDKRSNSGQDEKGRETRERETVRAERSCADPTTLSPGALGHSNLEKILLFPVQQRAWSPRSSDF